MACSCTNGLAIFGAYEFATLNSIEHFKVEALVDSGAMTTALDASDINMHVNRRGQRWVYYDFTHKPTAKTITMHQPVSRVVRIITHSGSPTVRPVITGTISIGKVRKKVEISLINRSNFPQQLLIGRNFLEGAALIQSGKKYLQRGK